MQNWYLRSKSRYAEYVRFNKVIDYRLIDAEGNEVTFEVFAKLEA